MVLAVAVFVVAFSLFSILLWLSDEFLTKHGKYRRMARREYRRIQCVINEPSEAYHIMRRMDPYVFEELVVYALNKKQHWKAWHGERYAGDGGIDGYARSKGRKYYIQDKRYSGVINPQHVKDFASILARDRVMGLFVHTGRTGSGGRDSRSGRMIFISGNRLLELMDHKVKEFLI